MAKKVKGYINIQIPAGEAKPSPPIGPALGQRGLNIMEFCKAFNEKTKDLEKSMPVRVVITAYEDRSFSFVIKTAPTSYFLKKAANIKKGSSLPGRGENIGSITWEQVREVARIKKEDLNAYDEEQACRMILGSARSMNIEVTGKA